VLLYIVDHQRGRYIDDAIRGRDMDLTIPQEEISPLSASFGFFGSDAQFACVATAIEVLR
jgi:hypothetical protein